MINYSVVKCQDSEKTVSVNPEERSHVMLYKLVVVDMHQLSKH